MNEFLLNLQASIRLRDVLDIVIVSVIVYRLLLLIRGTRAMQMLTGIFILGGGFFVASTFELFTSHWLLSHFFDYLILIVIVLFQDDLRRALATVGKNPFFYGTTDEDEREMVEEIVRAASRLAQEKTGALIVIERETGLKNFIDTGSHLDCKIKSEMIFSIFDPKSPLHDGAIIMTGGRIAAAGCFLPLSKDPNIDQKYGTRHRAALGMTEDTDAIVIVCSEEAGEISLVKNGKITVILNEEELSQSLIALLDLSRAQKNVPRRLRGWFQQTRRKKA